MTAGFPSAYNYYVNKFRRFYASILIALQLMMASPSTFKLAVSPWMSSHKREVIPSAEQSLQAKGNLKAAWHQRHIPLPFNLRDLGVNIYKGEVRDLLYQVFSQNRQCLGGSPALAFYLPDDKLTGTTVATHGGWGAFHNAHL